MKDTQKSQEVFITGGHEEFMVELFVGVIVLFIALAGWGVVAAMQHIECVMGL